MSCQRPTRSISQASYVVPWRTMTTDQAIGERVHAEMWRQRISQARLAELLGITQTAVSRKVRGDRPFFASELVIVAGALDVSVDALLPDDAVARYDDRPTPGAGRRGPNSSGATVPVGSVRRSRRPGYFLTPSDLLVVYSTPTAA